MAKIMGTRGMVQVQVLGIGESIKVLKKKGFQITNRAEFGLVRAADYVKSEVQESIMGNRGETRSVRTGKFANSPTTSPGGRGVMNIYPRDVTYAKYLEFGTSKISARRHFANTKNRTQNKVIDIIRREIRKI